MQRTQLNSTALLWHSQFEFGTRVLNLMSRSSQDLEALFRRNFIYLIETIKLYIVRKPRIVGPIRFRVLTGSLGIAGLEL